VDSHHDILPAINAKYNKVSESLLYNTPNEIQVKPRHLGL
jgi:hypothetical protein